MILALLLFVPFITGTLCLWASSRAWAQCISFTGLFGAVGITCILGVEIADKTTSPWLLELNLPWIPSWQVNFHLGVDSLAYWLTLLTLVLALFAVGVAAPQKRVGSYFASINWAAFGVIGLFLSADVFLFFVFWEVALLPIYWILVVEGERMQPMQTLRFIILTQFSGLMLIIGIIGLAYLSPGTRSMFTFDYVTLMKSPLSGDAQYWLMLCFFIAFLIKLPALPFHGWMPALFSEGPASVVLVAILVKTSVFGLMRFSWTMFPDATALFAEPAMILGVVTLLYGALLAFGQNDPRRIIAYGTLSHAGLLLVGVFCSATASFYGVLILLIASAISTAAMLMMFERRRNANLMAVTGLWPSHPRFSVVLLIMVLASMGFPVFGNFVGEWLIIWSVFAENTILAIVTSIGIVLSAAYSLRLFQRLCLGNASPTLVSCKSSLSDLNASELMLYGAMTIVVLGLGLSPSLFFNNVATPYADADANSLVLKALDSHESLQVVSP